MAWNRNPAQIDAPQMELIRATASSGAVSCWGYLIKVTSESLSTSPAGEYTLTITNPSILSTSTLFVSTGKWTATQGTPGVGWVTPATGSAVITVTNLHASESLNGTIVVNVLVVNGN
jgi:hypothetical protein